MKCLNCGYEVNNNVKFCAKCGTNVVSEVKIKDGNKTNKTTNNKKDTFVAMIIGCFMFILNVILKPVSTLKERLNDYSDYKNVGILLVLVSFCRMVINLVGNMISIVFVKRMSSYLKGDTKLHVDFENLKELDYLSLIFKEFFVFLIVIAILAGIYYLVALVMKKNANYFRLVTVTSVSFIPFIIVSCFISIIIEYIYAPLAFFLVCASFIYSLLTFINAMNDELDIDDSNLKVYFHTICSAVIIIITYYVVSNKNNTSIISFLK